MSQHRFKSKTYRFQSYNSSDLYSSLNTHTATSSQSNLQNNINSYSHPSEIIQNPLNLDVAPLPIWQPSTRLSKLHTQFQTTILSQYICLPCAFCGKLLYP